MVKAIIFDFFGVLCSDDYWRFVKAKSDMQGVFRNLSDSVNRGDISWQRFLDEVAAKTGKDVNVVKQMYESEKVNPELAAFIKQLQQNYKTALLTNASSDYIRPLLEKTGLNDVFNEIVISSEVGFIKPDPRIYQQACRLLGVQPAEAVFIDDSPPRTEGAENVGMQAICYKDFEQMKRELEQILTS